MGVDVDMRPATVCPDVHASQAAGSGLDICTEGPAENNVSMLSDRRTVYCQIRETSRANSDCALTPR